MTDPLSSPRLRIQSANEDIADLDRRIRVYNRSCPYKSVVEPDTDGVQQLHKIKLARPPPERLAVICARIVEDLRSALDQTGYAMAVAGGVPKPKFAYFPFARTAAEFENVIKGRCKNIPADILTLFRAYKGYQGGDDLLWALNVLCGASKHQLIKPVGQTVDGVWYERIQVDYADESNFLDILMGPPAWDRDKNEVVLFIAGPKVKFSYQGKLTIRVAFGDVEGVSGEPVIATLHALSSKVESIVNVTEAEARRIGLIA